MQTQHRARRAGAVAIAVILAAAVAPASADESTRQEAGADSWSSPVDQLQPGSQLVTLITGDEVSVSQSVDGKYAVALDPAQREGEKASFSTVEVDNQVYVIPSDAAALIPHVLDRELFNVTKLAEYGYTDEIPVIMSWTAGRTLASEPRGITVSAQLDSINAVAATIDSDAWWGSQRASLAATTGSAKVWLDEQVEVALDESVPQIGAPEAWDRGYDGNGVTVAVLDSGIDADHPDLAGTVVAEADFTGSGAVDRYGHGTHVAGIIAGQGTASNGTYVGVAPGVELLNGKVLGDRGTGRESWIIEGMEWAALDRGADVINMSLGTRGRPSDGTDVISQVVNQLTAATDALFVIAAGNDGPADTTVGSPGAADAALTVGAVDRADELASFSSRGPRRGDFAIKPDVTAPGVDIVAARAEGTSLGEPLDDNYTRLSGTSMATPHVAGAAAILRQADPTLTAGDLKAALATTGVPNDRLDIYQQGGGRIDVPAALDVPVLATPAPLDLGFFPFPQDDAEPVAKEVTYTNRTENPITLELSLDVQSRDGDVPSAAMLSVAPSTLTVEPGGTAAATVALDVNEGESGLYGGYLVAAAAGATVVHTPVGFYTEPERYTITVAGIARDGRPAARNADFDVINVDDSGEFLEWGISLRDGPATVKVPPGTYAIVGLIPTYDEANQFSQEQVLVSHPEVEVTEDTTVVLDARGANPITIDTPQHETEMTGWVTMGYRRVPAQGFWFGRIFNIAPQPHFATETEPVSVGDFEFSSRWRLVAPEAEVSPFVYDLLLPHRGQVPADLSFVADPDQLARLDTRYHGVPGHELSELRLPYSPGPWYGASFAIAYDVPAGTQRDVYLAPGTTEYQESVRAATPAGQLIGPLESYDPGAERVRSWLAGPLRPGFFGGRTDQRDATVTYRDGDELIVDISAWADTGGNAGSLEPATDTSAFRLYVDGGLVAETDRPQGTFPIAPDAADLRLEVDVARDAEWWTTSTSTRTAWTVSSGGTTDSPDVLPLLLVDYDADLDLTNTARHPSDRGGPHTVQLRVRHQPGADGPPIAGARAWVSYDDGGTWLPKPARSLGDGHFSMILDNRDPDETNGFAALKVEAWDAAGNRIEQEIIRAWQIPPR